MKYLNKFKVLLIINVIFAVFTMKISPKTPRLKAQKHTESSEFSQVPQLATNNEIINDAVKNIKMSLDNPDGKLSSICCTYRFNGTNVISKETKKYYDNYRKKPDYSKESFLNENIHQTDKIVQVKFNKHSDQISVTYKDPNDKGRRIYSESLDASQFQLA